MIDQQKIKDIVNKKLDECEEIWNKVDIQLSKSKLISEIKDHRPSDIPGHEHIDINNPKVDTFVALNIDIRDSSKHLLHAISKKKGVKASQLERVFYETTAVLSSSTLIIESSQGRVTEYLGDGVLALFQYKDEHTISNVYRCAQDCLDSIIDIVNPILAERYGLPKLEIGIGLACSEAILTLVGLDTLHPKAFGECVFRSCKLSSEKNSIVCDKKLKYLWPSSKGGLLKFIGQTYNGINGYQIYKK